MTTDQNKSTAQRFFDLFNAGKIEAMSEIFVTDVVDHNPLPGQPGGLEGIQWALYGLRAAFPDLTVTVDNLVAEGDYVTTHQVARGTHKGELLGIPPTGKPIVMEAADQYRIVNGKIVEAWHLEDLFGVLMQLGAIPAPKAAA